MSEVTDSKEQSFENYLEEKRRDANEVFNGLSTEQKIEIRRRFDIAISAGYRAHKLSELITKGMGACDEQSALKTKSDWIFVVALAFLYLITYGIKDIVSINTNLIYLAGVPLLFSLGVRYDLYAISQRVKKMQNEIDVLAEKWDDVVPNYSLEEFLKWSLSLRFPQASDRTALAINSVALKRSIIASVSFKYSFA
jgi:Flp pilus assembly protein TadB